MAGTNKRIFRARAASWGLGESSTGKEQVAVEFRISTENADVQSITWYGYFTEATADRTLESLRHCGWTGDDLLNLEGLDTNEVDLVIEDEEYNNQVRPKVQWVNRVGGVALSSPLTGDRARAFAAAMKDKIRALDASNGVRKQAAPAQQQRKQTPPNGRPSSPPASRGGALPPEPPPWDDKDIPF